jgi:predicted PurR-regulated permease PerM
MEQQSLFRDFQKALIWIGVAAALCLIWQIRFALLLAFAAILLAIILRVLADVISRLTGLREGVALAISTLLIFALLCASIGLFGYQVSDQFRDLTSRLQTGEKAVMAFLRAHGLGNAATDLNQHLSSLAKKYASGVLFASLSILEGAVVMVISAIYLAARPFVYRRGAAMLFGRRLRDEVDRGILLIGTSLKLWLLGQLIIMAIVGALSFVAVLLIGLPSPAALALIAGITEIVPYLGPFIGAIPAVFVALSKGVEPALWTVAAYLGIHLIEGYFIAPMLQRRFVRIPPALALIGIVAMGYLFGTFGVVIAVPLTATIMIAVKVFYVRDTLHEKADIPEESPL